MPTMIRPVTALAVAALALVGCSTPESTPTPGVTVTTPSSSELSNAEQHYLNELRASGVPVSESGFGEIQVGRGVCQQVAHGAVPAALARDLTVIGWSGEQTAKIVEIAQRILCE